MRFGPLPTYHILAEWEPPYNTGNFSIPARNWVANLDGEVLGLAGHLHDGGQNVKLTVDGKLACDSEAKYGEKPEFVAKKAMHPGSALEHVSSMSICVNDKLLVKQMTKGQKWKLTVDYDYNKNKGMVHEGGKQSSVMGIAIMYVRVKST